MNQDNDINDITCIQCGVVIDEQDQAEALDLNGNYFCYDCRKILKEETPHETYKTY